MKNLENMNLSQI